MNRGRIQRLLRLITILQSGRAQSVRDLTTELCVSRRTLFRDLNVLEEAGIPYYHDPQFGYRIKQSFFLPPVSLTVPETLGLLVLGKTARAYRSGPLLSAALSAVNKLITSVPEPMRSACAEMMAHVSVDPGPQAIASAETRYYNTLQRCIDEHRACRMVYESLAEQQTLTCEIEPYALHFSSLAWYVLGRTDVHDEVRVFKILRIRSLELLERFFHRPSNFTVADKLGKAWRLIPEGKIYRVELEFSAKVASNVSEILWHESQQVTSPPDGRCVMTLEVDGVNEIAWWICGYADQVIVRKPEALRRRVKEMLEAAQQHYQDLSTTGH